MQEALLFLRDRCNKGHWTIKDMFVMLQLHGDVLHAEALLPSSALWDMVYWYAPPLDYKSTWEETPVAMCCEWFSVRKTRSHEILARLNSLRGVFRAQANDTSSSMMVFPVYAINSMDAKELRDADPVTQEKIEALLANLQYDRIFTVQTPQKWPHLIHHDRSNAWMDCIQGKRHAQKTEHCYHTATATTRSVHHISWEVSWHFRSPQLSWFLAHKTGDRSAFPWEVIQL